MQFSVFKEPDSEYVVIPLILMGLLLSQMWPGALWFLVAVSLMGLIPTLAGALSSLQQLRLSVDTLNFFAIAILFASGEIRVAAMVILIILASRLLAWLTDEGARKSIVPWISDRPETASLVDGDAVTEIDVNDLRVDDLILVKENERVPVDGMIAYGQTEVDESPITGDSRPISKSVGDAVYAMSLTLSGTVRVRASRIGRSTTMERMIRSVKVGERSPTKPEVMARRLSGMFLPVILAAGALLWYLTKEPRITVALFLVVSADEVASAIPLAVTGAMRRACRMGVVVQSGRWLDALDGVKTIVFDKTGSLSFGESTVEKVVLAEGVAADRFWCAVAVAERQSEHPIGRVLFREAITRCPWAGEPLRHRAIDGQGVIARLGPEEIAVGGKELFAENTVQGAEHSRQALGRLELNVGQRVIAVSIDGSYLGHIILNETPSSEAAVSIADLRTLGVRHMELVTVDDQAAANRTADLLGLDQGHGDLNPNQKQEKVKGLKAEGRLALVGDGMGDAAVMTLADVGLAMGSGNVVSSEQADLAITTDRLDRLPAMIRLARATRRTIRINIVMWLSANALGMALVLGGFLSPAAAAGFSLASAFLPMANSLAAFRAGSQAAGQESLNSPGSDVDLTG